MFSHLLYPVVIATILQGAVGGRLEELVESHTSSVLQPLQEVTRKLEANLAELELKKRELEFHKKQIEKKLANVPEECQHHGLQFHFSFFNKWDLDSCVNLTDDWVVGANLASDGAVLTLNLTKTIATIGNKILNCPNLSLTKVLPCYNENINKLREAISSIKGQTGPFIDTALKIATNMKKDFDHCVGISYMLKDRLERHLESIKCSMKKYEEA